jgi:hypothetical protein
LNLGNRGETFAGKPPLFRLSPKYLLNGLQDRN